MTLQNPTTEMIAFYEARTLAHIARVSANLYRLNMVLDYGNALLERAAIHDASKFSSEEYIPYVWMTEDYRCRRQKLPFKYPAGVKKEVDHAVKHHMKNNRHHPAFHNHPNDMTEVDLVEMVCDWAAMEQEFGQNGGDVTAWANKVLGKKISFNSLKTAFVYQVIDLLNNQIALEKA